ncbi:MAG TPA: metalloregulator ArsR/SmtB family transcription factor [Acetobacteraceae bacterium]|nr:metalloregulator ArsR/SmtB family transcription factor [Acetobacteraceae bacterium]
MDTLLTRLRAAAEPTRLRLLALAARGGFCVSEFTEILGQSQPRLSRHLKLLGDAGLLERMREGANVWFTLPQGPGGDQARTLLAWLPPDDPLLAADRRRAARVVAERARIASDGFRQRGAEWDEMGALGLAAEPVEAALLALLPERGIGRLLDIGTGTGQLLELLARRVDTALGIDASRAMLALARARLGRAGLDHCAVRQADMYCLPLADASFDAAVLQMVLHYAEDPAAALAEAARVLRPGGRLVVADLAAHGDRTLAARLAHRWPGFSNTEMLGLLRSAGLRLDDGRVVPGRLEVRLWSARRGDTAAGERRVPPGAAAPRHAAAASGAPARSRPAAP